jgi:hypothetical protein
MKQFRLIMLAFACPLALFSQDITGLWSGTLFNDSTQQNHQYEIGICKEKGKYVAYSHTWFMIEGKKYYGLKKVKVRIAGDGKIVVQDDELISNNYPIAPNKNVRQLNILSFSSIGTTPMMEGPFVTSRTKDYNELTGHINLTRKGDFTGSDLVTRLEQIGQGIEFTLTPGKAELIVWNGEK